MAELMPAQPGPFVDTSTFVGQWFEKEVWKSGALLSYQRGHHRIPTLDWDGAQWLAHKIGVGMWTL